MNEKRPVRFGNKPVRTERKPVNTERQPVMMEGLAARRAALKVIRQVTEGGAYASLALDAALKNSGLGSAEGSAESDPPGDRRRGICFAGAGRCA